MKRLMLMAMAVSMAAGAFAGSGPKINPQFLKWQKMKAAGLLPAQKQAKKEAKAPVRRLSLKTTSTSAKDSASADSWGLGLMPEIASMNHITDLYQPVGLNRGEPLPSKFDLRENDGVTSVRDQGVFNTCWAFATFASLESAMLLRRSELDRYTAADLDLSEKHLVDNSGFNVSANDFGSMLMSVAYLTRWAGPVLESVSPYPPKGTIVWTRSSATGAPQVHVQEVRWLPGRISSTDNDIIKRAVMELGAVYATMYWDSTYYNEQTYAYRSIGVLTLTDPAAPRNPNHGVTIVG